MRHETDDPRNSSPQILPLVIAAFAGAILAIACERPGSRGPAEDPYAQSGGSPAQAKVDARARHGAQPAQSAANAVAPGDALNDTVITARIKSSILSDPAMAGADVSVNTDHGAVSLLGSVKSQEQIAIASAHAQRQDGVLRVDNHLSAHTS